MLNLKGNEKTMVLSQKSLISEAKLRIRGIAKEIADLKREKLYLDCLIENDTYLTSVKQEKVSNNWQAKLKHGQRNKKNMLKAVMGG